MTDDEALLLLIDDELPPELRESLMRRMSQEPILAQRYRELEELNQALQELPSHSPPRSLDAAVLNRHEQRLAARTSSWKARTRQWIWPLIGIAATAALILWPTIPKVSLESGVQRISGEVSVDAAGLPVWVDGDVLIQVEPDRGLGRVNGPEAIMGMKSNAISAISGVVVTIFVYEGTARIGDGRELVAGEQWRSPQPVFAQVSPNIVQTIGGVDPEISQAIHSADPRVQSRIAELESKLAQLNFEHSLSLGQLRALSGEPIPWPENLPKSAEPATFEAAIRQALPADQYTFEEIDCEEFPCVATVRVNEVSEQAADKLDAAVSAFAKTTYGEDVRVHTMTRGVDGQVTASLSFIPEEFGSDDISARARRRGEEALEAAIDNGSSEEP